MRIRQGWRDERTGSDAIFWDLSIQSYSWLFLFRFRNNRTSFKTFRPHSVHFVIVEGNNVQTEKTVTVFCLFRIRPPKRTLSIDIIYHW